MPGRSVSACAEQRSFQQYRPARTEVLVKSLYHDPEDWVFPSNSSRAGRKRGRQPMWLETVMRYHIKPLVKELGIHTSVSWHTFRRTYATVLKATGEDVKVVQELLRHGSSRVTLDVYAQAQMPAKGLHNRKSSQWSERRFRNPRFRRALKSSPNCSAEKSRKIS